MTIVCSHIVPDVTQGKPGIVTVTFFNTRGEKTQEQVLNGDLFPRDLKVGDELIFTKKEKHSSISNPITAMPSLLEN